MKILVVGAKGILGRAFWRMSSSHHDFVAYDMGELDITRREDTEEKVAAVNPAVVVNCAAYTDVDGCETNRDKAFAVNADGVKNLAKACLGGNRSLVHVSTDYIFDGAKRIPYREDDPPHPLSTYGESKLQGEMALRQILPEEHFLLVRSQWLYGEGGRNFVDTILNKAKELPRLKVVDDQFGSPTYAQDLASAIIRLIERNTRGIFHIANRGIVNWYDFAGMIIKMSRLQCTILPQSSQEANRPARRPSFSALDCSKFEEKTGVRLRGWEEALAAYLQTRGKE